MNDRPGHSDAPRDQASPTLDPTASGTTWIVVAASVIGVLTVLLVGTTVAVTRSGDSPSEPQTSPSASASAEPSTPSTTTPPAAEGSANISCDGSYIVEIARSSKASADAGVERAAARARNGKFLDASASCSTYSAEGVRRVAYIGPFTSLAAACAARVKAGDLTAMLHRMDADQRGPSYCVCTDSPDPVLEAGAGTNGDIATLLTIGDVQRMLKALGLFKPKIAGDPYGPRTISAVQAFQTDRNLVASGVVDRPTWTALRRSKDDRGRPLC
jgi:hypothetical protein